MWDWLQQNAQGVSAIASVATLCVWLFYAQLLFAAFRRQRQARVLINQGWGERLNSVCLVSNMSHEAIYIQCIIISLRTAHGKYRSSVTDFDDAEPYDSRNKPQEVTRQGPLKSGDFLNLGTFRTLIRQASEQHNLTVDAQDPVSDIGLENFMITVILGYGPEGQSIGVQRTFLVFGETNLRMRPASIYSHRMQRGKARRKMERWLKEVM